MNNNESQSPKDELEKNAAANEESFTDSIEKTEEEKHDDAHVQPSQPEQSVPAPKGGSSKVWMAISAVLAVLLVVVLIKPPFGGGGGSEAVASVNGVAITKDKLYDELVIQGGKVTLDNIISEELIMQAAKKANVSVTDEEVQSEIQLIIDNVGSEEQFDMLLSQYGMTRESLSQSKYYDILIRKILEPQTNVTEEDIKAYYDENVDYLGTPATVRASHILVETKEEADEIYQQLQNGADFATLVQEHSIDTATVATEGDVDFFTAGEMETNFSNAAFGLKVGEISQPVESSAGYGYHIIKKTDEKAAATPTLEEKQEEIRLLLVTEQVSGLSSEWMTNLRNEAKITNTLDTTESTTAN